jgi:hypothetical protein
MTPSQTSVNNSFAGDDENLPPVTDAQGNPLPLTEFGGMEDYAEEPVPAEVRQATANIPQTGTLFNLAPFEQIAQLHAAGQTDEARKVYNSLNDQAKYVYDNARNMERFTSAKAAELADEYRKMQDAQTKTEMQGATPTARAELAAAQADAAAKQAEIQEAYRQEVEYQRSLATINDSTKNSAERNAARMQIEALSAGIGKRINPKLGTSAAAMNEAKNAVGYIGAYEYKNPLADFGSRISTMQRNSQERMGLVRQQMEAAGVPLPEAAPTPAAPNPAQMVLERFGVKAPDGNPVMFNGSPVVSFKRAGKDVMARQTPNGGFVELTAEESAALRGQ